ncbi:ATP-grasp domain-containing protein [Ornithinimicrobium sp. Y1694]|uniref:ATP-grasp domain-containing protein n=1 Tax=Ornithinimicrobium sp. Y1694 TaxID=3418590 RepID=UPI003CF5BF70
MTVLVEDRYREQAQPAGLVSALRARGADVRLVGDRGAIPTDCLTGTDVVVARGRSDRVLRALAAAEQAGVPTLDGAAAVRKVRDKGEMTARLLEVGLPVPRTFVGRGPDMSERLAPLWDAAPGTHGWIVKPRFGDNSRGVARADSLGSLARRHEELVVQEFIPGSGADLKLYVIGTQVFAARKPSPVTPCTLDPAELGPVVVTERLQEIAEKCGRAFGLTLFGVDCVESGPDLVVIEVNDFPNYTHVPTADDLLARHVLGSVR